MKKILVTFLMLGAVVLLSMTSAYADSFTFSDIGSTAVINWPGTSPITNTNDTIGSPTVGSFEVITYNDNSLDQVIIGVHNRTSALTAFDSLYINSNYNGPSNSFGPDWQSWDYYVEDIVGGSGPKLYTVGSDYQYGYVSLLKHGERAGHVNQIIGGLTNPIAASVTYDGTYLTYKFDKDQIMIDGDFVIGYTEWCANDVYVTPPTSVPEPTQMLLLGTALIGLAGIGRKKFFKK
jgi:hypothetical protein